MAKKSTMKKLFTGLLVGVLAIIGVSLIGLNAKVDNSIKTRDLKAIEYEIGSLGDTGAKVESTASIITKDFVNVDGLIIKVSDDANITYKLFYYDEEQNFISKSEDMTTDSNSTTVVEGAKYFKIMITPNNDNEVSLIEISKYAKRVTVTVNK